MRKYELLRFAPAILQAFAFRAVALHAHS